MLSLNPLTLGKLWYYLLLAAVDYYIHGGERPGRWWGRGSAAKGLTHTVEPGQFKTIFEGYDHRTKQALVQNAGVSDRHVGDDLTFSVPKSVSIYLSQCDRTKQDDVIQFHDSSVSAALSFIEKVFAFCRVGKGGRERIRALLIVAVFLHLTSREMQVQLHSHALVLNAGVSTDGENKTRALDNRFLYRKGSKLKKVFGAYYRANLAHLLTTKHGLVCVRKGESFEIRDIPDELIEAHSLRSQQMDAYIEKHKLDPNSAKDAARAAIATRRTKQDVPTPEELWKTCRELNRKYGFTDKSLRRLVRRVKRDPQRDMEAALAAALESLTKTHTHFNETDFLYATLLEAPERGLPPDAVVSAVTDYLANSKEIVRFRLRDGQTRYTTPRMIEEEKRLLAAMKALQETPGIRVKESIVRKVLARHPELSEEQKKAVRHIVQPNGSLAIVSALAGTGKSSKVAKIAAEIWRKAGYRVIGAAPTGKAARVLEEETGIPTETNHRRLGDYKTSRRRKLKHHVKQVGRALRGKRTYRLKPPEPVKIDKKSVWMGDEFGMTNTRHTRMILEQAVNGGGMVVMFGDPFQLPPVEGSAPFHSICNRVGYAELTEVRRQKDEWARLATRLFAEGNPGDALDLYAQHGLVTVRDNLDEALEALALDWTNPGLTHPQDAIVLVDSNRRSEAANALLQQKRIEAGCLDTSTSLEVIDDDRNRGVTYCNRVYRGDRVLFTCNDRKYGVENGSLGTVIGLNTWRNTISVKLDDGRRTIIPVRKYPHIRLGYAMTVYKAQGSTVPTVLVLANGEKECLPLSYVEATRGVLVTRFYTEKAYLDEAREQVHESRLAKQMSRKPDLRLVTDLLDEAQTATAHKLSSSETAAALPSEHRSCDTDSRDTNDKPYSSSQTARNANAAEFFACQLAETTAPAVPPPPLHRNATAQQLDGTLQPLPPTRGAGDSTMASPPLLRHTSLDDGGQTKSPWKPIQAGGRLRRQNPDPQPAAAAPSLASLIAAFDAERENEDHSRDATIRRHQQETLRLKKEARRRRKAALRRQREEARRQQEQEARRQQEQEALRRKREEEHEAASRAQLQALIEWNREHMRQFAEEKERQQAARQAPSRSFFDSDSTRRSSFDIPTTSSSSTYTSCCSPASAISPYSQPEQTSRSDYGAAQTACDKQQQTGTAFKQGNG
jgi:conjugative relaxase-like TrwC/TraI family protein